MVVTTFIVLSAVTAPTSVGVAWTHGPNACFRDAEHQLIETLEGRGYDVRDTDADVWLDIQVGRPREPELRRFGDNITLVSAYAGGKGAHAIADTTACGPELTRQVTERALALLDASRDDWSAEALPVSYYSAQHDRFRGEPQPVEVGAFVLFPGSSDLYVGLSARTDQKIHGVDVTLGPDIALRKSDDITVWEPGLTLGFHDAHALGASTAWSYGIELAALLAIYDAPNDDGVRFAGRLGLPVKLGVLYNHAALTVMPFVRTGGYDVENWGVLIRLGWGMGGRH